jgi:hypothetical protein
MSKTKINVVMANAVLQSVTFLDLVATELEILSLSFSHTHENLDLKKGFFIVTRFIQRRPSL